MDEQIIGIFYDANGNLVKIVGPDGNDFAPHADASLLQVSISKTAYLPVSSPINVSGRAEYHALNKLAVSVLTTLNADAGAKLQAHIDAVDAAIAARAASDAAFAGQE